MRRTACSIFIKHAVQSGGDGADDKNRSPLFWRRANGICFIVNSASNITPRMQAVVASSILSDPNRGASGAVLRSEQLSMWNKQTI
jgi:hypothetical protein